MRQKPWLLPWQPAPRLQLAVVRIPRRQTRWQTCPQSAGWVTPDGASEQCVVTMRDTLVALRNGKVEVEPLFRDEAPAMGTECAAGSAFSANQLPKGFGAQLQESQATWERLVAAAEADTKSPTAHASKIKAFAWVMRVGTMSGEGSNVLAAYDGHGGRDFGPDSCSVGGDTITEAIQLGTTSYDGQTIAVDRVTSQATGAPCGQGDVILVPTTPPSVVA